MNSKYTTKELIRYALKRAKGIPVRINLETYYNFVSEVKAIDYSRLSDEAIIAAMDVEQLAETFALISEVIKRCLRLKPYPEQLAAGKILLENKIAQMQTGEGKTLAAVFAAVVQVKRGGRVHIFTANEYLAGRDSRWMEVIYSFFGISVSVITEGMSAMQKKCGYGADVTYLTVKQAGFDYLRDCLNADLSARIMPDFKACIIDEADFIMIDEARTPLVIVRERSENYIDSVKADKAAKKLIDEKDYIIDRRARKCVLSLEGVGSICREFDVDESTIDGRIIVSGINAALHARTLLDRDVDYIVGDDKIELIDSHTGRKADKREWPYGIQRALEAKEGVSIKADGEVCGSITIENFISLYPSVSAMTATAEPAAAEFFRTYGLGTCVIPPHRPDKRVDLPDMVFRTKDAKLKMLVKLVQDAKTRRQPVLIGTASIRESDEVSRRFDAEGIVHRVLNAKQDAREADLISRAGEAGAVTVATNMAGRGTDILLGGPSGRDAESVKKTGGLFVIGLNRNDSMRVDHQLRGRSGRQGDPGCSLFLMSLEDDLFMKYGIKEFLPEAVLDFNGDAPLENLRATREIARAQEIIEGQHAIMRRTLHNYSLVIEKYRKRIVELKTDAAGKGLFPLELLRKIESADQRTVTQLFIFELDEFWAQFLAYTDYVKEGIYLRRFGKREPLLEFIDEANAAFTEGMTEAVNKISRALEEDQGADAVLQQKDRNGSTWTYQIDDNPFPSFSLGLIGMNIGIGAAVGPFLLLFAPVLLIKWIVERLKKA